MPKIALLRSHIETKIDESALELSPFPHLIIEKFFPEEIYAEVLARNPFQKNVGVKWMEETSSKNVTARTPYHARKQINFHENQRFDCSPEDQSFWQMIESTFITDNWFEKLVIRKFPHFFAVRFGDEANIATNASGSLSRAFEEVAHGMALSGLMGWKEEQVSEIRRKYVDDGAIVVALGKHIANIGVKSAVKSK